MIDISYDAIERWTNDLESPRKDYYGGRDMFYLALDRGIVDPRIVANAVALSDYAAFIYERYGGRISYDSIVDGLLNGVDYPVQPYWWYVRWYYRMKLFFKRLRRNR